MKMSKVGNQTNSQDPQAVNSRVFVGNLNTFQCSKTDVERMFQRYGRLAGISMHKGYAFVQFTNPFDARSACLGEDGRTVLSQILDVNMVAEPKPHQTGRKRQNVTKTGNDWDYYYDSYYASTTASFPAGPAAQRLVSPLKRPRLMPPPGGSRPAKIAATNSAVLQSAITTTTTTNQKVNSVNNSPGNNGINNNNTTCNLSNSTSTSSISSNSTILHNIEHLKTYSNPDILICGNCREMFSELKELIEHKKNYCKLRFTCKCQAFNSNPPNDEIFTSSTDGNDMNTSVSANTVSLLCVQCKDSFSNAWDLMVHAQAAHMVNIYDLGVAKTSRNNGSSSEHSFTDEQQNTNENGCTMQENQDIDEDEEENSSNLNSTNTINNIIKYENCDVPCFQMVETESNARQCSTSSISTSYLNDNQSEIDSDQHDDEIDSVDETSQACIMHTISIEPINSDKSCSILSGKKSNDNNIQTPQLVVTNGKP